jgi:uncharacterized membrane protein required for colicin V production
MSSTRQRTKFYGMLAIKYVALLVQLILLYQCITESTLSFSCFHLVTLKIVDFFKMNMQSFVITKSYGLANRMLIVLART